MMKQMTYSDDRTAGPSPVAKGVVRHQRVDGHGRIVFSRSGISDLYQRAPCRLLFPDGEKEDFPLAVLLTTSGGLTGGDRMCFDMRVAEGARGTVTTQAAEKLYRVLPGDPDIRIDTRIEVAHGGIAEWLAQEAILFDRSRLRRTVDVDLMGDARMLGVELTMFGRDAMGERFATGLLHDGWRVRRDGRLIWADALHLDGDCTTQAALPFGFGEARAIATLIYAGPDAATHVELARTLAPAPHGGATCINDILILRLIDSDAMALRAATVRALSALRAATIGAPTRLPAVWTC